MKKRIIFTGGHHNSALAVIDWLQLNHGDKIDIYWAGKRHIRGTKVDTPEFTEVTKRKIPFYDIKAGRIFRTTSLLYAPKVLYEMALIPIGFFYAFYILVRIRPVLIVSFGGYLALPLVVIGRLFGIPSITHEQTTVLGLANLVITNFVEKVYTAWPVSFYKVSEDKRKKFNYVGLPLRDVVKRAKNTPKKKNRFRKAFENNLPLVFLTGGKSGSKFLNKMMFENLEIVLEKANLIWQCGRVPGKYGYNDLKNKIDKLQNRYKKKVVIRSYILEDEIGEALSSADLVVCRGGAHTIYELAYLKKPAIVVPIPWSSNNEQASNAMLLKKMGLAEVLDEESISALDFRKEILKMLRNLYEYKLKNQIKIESKGQEKLGNEIIQFIH